MSKTIGILTGGGDVPGLNPAIKAAVVCALENEYRVIGIRRGWQGLLHYDFDEPSTHDYYMRELEYVDVRTIEIDALISIGGDDTLSFAARLHKEGFPVVGIPKTMDNDVFGTDYCIGFSTAITRSVNFITDMRTSVGSHERIGIVELFGRNSGETSLITALLAHVDRGVISEVPFDINKLANFLMDDKRRNPSNYAIMTVSEGATYLGGEIIETGEADAFGHRKLGGIGLMISDDIKRITKNNTMFQQLTYVIRSGPPDSVDRLVGMAYGTIALNLVKANDTGKLAALKDGKYTAIPLDSVIAGKKYADVDSYYDKENYLPKVREFIGHPLFLT